MSQKMKDYADDARAACGMKPEERGMGAKVVDTIWSVARCCSCGSANIDIGSYAQERDRLRAANAELVRALEAIIAFNEPDSLSDQKTDIQLQIDAHQAWERAKAALAKSKEPR